MTWALNPLQWYATPDGGLDFTQADPVEVASAVIESGFRAMPLDMLPDAAAPPLVPAPGYLELDLGAPPDDAFAAVADAVAAHVQAGLRVAFIADRVRPERLETPAVGAPLPVSLEKRIACLAGVVKRIRRHGITPLLHQHVGTGIETEEELAAALTETDIGLGLDTGHATWAGMDPGALVDRWPDRIGGLHLKDVSQSIIDQARSSRWTYRHTVANGLWREPGWGDLDLESIARRFPSLWKVIEVDWSRLPPEESARRCFDWMERITND